MTSQDRTSELADRLVARAGELLGDVKASEAHSEESRSSEALVDRVGVADPKRPDTQANPGRLEDARADVGKSTASTTPFDGPADAEALIVEHVPMVGAIVRG